MYTKRTLLRLVLRLPRLARVSSQTLFVFASLCEMGWAGEIERTHGFATRDPFLPQKFDLGGAIGTAWSSSEYFLGEVFIGFQLMHTGDHCFSYVDASERVTAQNGQTNYMTTLGWRFQKYFDGSMWGPYFRPFVGENHYLYSGAIQDTGVAGIALGSFYYLHPVVDLRFEVSQAFGPIPWTALSIGGVVKFRNL